MPAKLTADQRHVMEDRVTLARVSLTWPTVERWNADEDALDIFGSILAGGRSSRLYQRLVYREQAAQTVNAGQGSRPQAGQFSVTVMAREGSSLSQLEREVYEEIARLATEGPTPAEMARAKNGNEARSVYQIQTLLGKADRINQYLTERGTPDMFNQDLGALQRRNRRRRQARRGGLYQQPPPHHPVGGAQRPSRTGGPGARGASMKRSLIAAAVGAAAAAAVAGSLHGQQLDRSKRPAAAAAAAVTAPVIVKRTLPNGLQVWSVTRRELPIVNALLLVRAGSAMDGATAGIADVTASLLDDGAGGRSAVEFANALDFLGANLNANAGDEQTQISLLTLRKQADSAFALMGDMVVRPAFADSELTRERRARLQTLRSQKDRPTVIATQTFNRLVYGADHPYGHPGNGTPATIEKLTRADLAGFYDAYYRPNNAVLIVVGDVSAAEAQALASRAFGGWKSKPVPALAAAIPARPASHPTGVYLVDKPGAAQSEIRIGHALTSRSTTPDYYALRVLNAALGGAFTSRVNLNIREAKGYTYGARTTMTFERGAGPFTASAGVFTAKTDSSLIEFMKEIRDSAGLGRSRRRKPICQGVADPGLPARPRDQRRCSGHPGRSRLLPAARHRAHRLSDEARAGEAGNVTRVAEKYLAPDSSVVVVVGDLSKIQPGVEALHLGPVTVLDADGLAWNSLLTWPRAPVRPIGVDCPECGWRTGSSSDGRTGRS